MNLLAVVCADACLLDGTEFTTVKRSKIAFTRVICALMPGRIALVVEVKSSVPYGVRVQCPEGNEEASKFNL